jgi:hypothetical protein
MLDVAKKMLGYRARAGLRDDGAAAELWQQLEPFHSDSDSHPHNPGTDADLRTDPIDDFRMCAGNNGENRATGHSHFLCPGAVQLQRGHHLPGRIGVSRLVRQQLAPDK